MSTSEAFKNELDFVMWPENQNSCLFCLETSVSGHCFGLCLACECIRMRWFIDLKTQLVTRIKNMPGKEMCPNSSPTCKRDAIRDQRSLLCAGAWCHVTRSSGRRTMPLFGSRQISAPAFQQPKQNPRAFDASWCKFQSNNHLRQIRIRSLWIKSAKFYEMS